MKKYYLLLLIILACFKLTAQNYRLFQGSADYFFADSTGYFIAFKADSVNANANDSLYYNFRSLHDTMPFECLWVDGPSWAGMEILSLQTGVVYFFNKKMDTLFFNTQLQLNDSIVFYVNPNGSYYSCKVTAIDTMTVQSILDSVKYFTLQLYDISGNPMADSWNGRQIIVSKDHGLVQVFRISDFPGGSSNNYLRVDVNLLTQGEIFNFEVGDEFQNEMQVLGIMGSMGPPDYQKWKVIGKSLSAAADTVFYTIEKTLIDASVVWVPSPHLVYNITVDTVLNAYTHLDSVYYDYPEKSIIIMDTAQGFGNYEYNNMHYFGCSNQLAVTHYGGYYYLQIPGDSCFRYAFEPVYENRTYAKGLGLVNYTSDWLSQAGTKSTISMFYYKKGSTICGTPTTANIEEIEPYQLFSIYPNPADQFITLDLKNISNNVMINVADINGRTITEQNYETANGTIAIPTSQLKNGVYFLKVSTNNFNSILKMVVMH